MLKTWVKKWGSALMRSMSELMVEMRLRPLCQKASLLASTRKGLTGRLRSGIVGTGTARGAGLGPGLARLSAFRCSVSGSALLVLPRGVGFTFLAPFFLAATRRFHVSACSSAEWRFFRFPFAGFFPASFSSAAAPAAFRALGDKDSTAPMTQHALPTDPRDSQSPVYQCDQTALRVRVSGISVRVRVMGNTESMESQLAVIRARAAPVKLPMPDPAELEERFSIALNSMNLPPDKVRLLRCYDNEKKWELICDQERFQVKNPPHTYIQRLQSFLDPAVTRKKFRRRVQESTQTLRELEISLRTNHIGWVREFLNEENQGLHVLVEYLSFAQYANTFDGEQSEGTSEASSVDSPWSRSIEDLHGDSNLPSPSSGHNIPRASRHSISSTLVSRSNTLPSRRTLKNSRLVSKKDDVHVCVMCLRAIMNYQYGFNMVMSHPHAVNEIALSLNNRNPRTKALVLELLAAVCLVRGGHEIILSAFDNFKTVCSESMRFEKLMEHFKNEDDNIDFMVCVSGPGDNIGRQQLCDVTTPVVSACCGCCGCVGCYGCDC
ncbi:Formin-like protein 2 [Merluccius polli]|uniref:Formin-like protein 2 n=1 Tax=Merluccius polli TaxID=89951 RepID=A0AA47MA39_MERPO|nr:Formin-like protein 2 [Merluccius polli]